MGNCTSQRTPKFKVKSGRRRQESWKYAALSRMRFRSTAPTCEYCSDFSSIETERLMVETRPVRTAYMFAASLRLVVELLGKLVVSKREVVPVFTGSLVAMPKVAV